MAHKPKIEFRLREDGNVSSANVNGISIQYQLTLEQMGGERHCKLQFEAEFMDIGLEGEWSILLNVEAAQNLAHKLNTFLESNTDKHGEQYE